jgi:YidC/Oxa1 family membrane protein insertase
VLTLVIKVILFWPALSALKAQKKLQDTQPMVEEIRRKYKDNKEELGKQLMEFYKNNKVNPFSSCLPILIQLPILIALYRAFFQGLQVDPATHLLAAEQVQHLYGFLAAIYSTTPIDTSMFGFIDLSATHNVVLAVLAGVASFFQAKTLQTKRAAIRTTGSKDEDMAASVNKQMMYIIPVLTVVFGWQFPAGVTIYWLVSTLFSLAQQLYFFRVRKKLNEPTVVNAPQ